MNMIAVNQIFPTKLNQTITARNQYREDLSSTGIYFLFGRNPEDEDKDLIYIGEAESLIDRLKQHLGSKEFWIEAICVLSKDENLNKSHVKYLEKRLYDLALSANRYKIENNTIPAKTTISEPDQAEMEELNGKIQKEKPLNQMKQYSQHITTDYCFDLTLPGALQLSDLLPLRASVTQCLGLGYWK